MFFISSLYYFLSLSPPLSPLSLSPLSSNAGEPMGIWRWNENIVFDILVTDVPRGARLCLAIYAVYGSKKKKAKTGKNEAKGVSTAIPGHLLYSSHFKTLDFARGVP